MRGNVLTRLRKLDEGQYGALVLACAGLKRLGLENRISRVFSVDEILPAACQGVLAVQSRDGFDTLLLDCFHDPDAAVCAGAGLCPRARRRLHLPSRPTRRSRRTGTLTTGLNVDENDGLHKRTITSSRERCETDAAALAPEMKNGGCENE